jgi:hypothetical protein
LSLGFDFAQLDVGYRDHWLSPLSDGSVLISTEAATMPSVTVSNYAPITRLGLNYEIFLAQLSRQENIAYFGSTTSGYPRLAGLQLGMEPVSGYAVSPSSTKRCSRTATRMTSQGRARSSATRPPH